MRSCSSLATGTTSTPRPQRSRATASQRSSAAGSSTDSAQVVPANSDGRRRWPSPTARCRPAGGPARRRTGPGAPPRHERAIGAFTLPTSVMVGDRSRPATASATWSTTAAERRERGGHHHDVGPATTSATDVDDVDTGRGRARPGSPPTGDHGDAARQRRARATHRCGRGRATPTRSGRQPSARQAGYEPSRFTVKPVPLELGQGVADRRVVLVAVEGEQEAVLAEPLAQRPADDLGDVDAAVGDRVQRAQQHADALGRRRDHDRGLVVAAGVESLAGDEREAGVGAREVLDARGRR